MVLLARKPRIVLSGGPKSGKTTLMRILAEEFADDLQFMPEVATLLHDHVGVKVPTPGTPQHARYSRHLTLAQIALEDAADIQAHADGKLASLCDRGIVDNIAYLAGGNEEFERVTGVDLRSAYGRYDLPVVLALAPREVFEDRARGGNASRKETYDEAVPLDARTYGVWRIHPYTQFVGNEGGWDNKALAAVSIVRQFLDRIRGGAR